ncbi:putative membrane protein [Helicobacter pylori Hp H-30]|nr:putative membrane protein [Helicobacter pylori Hp H-30]
MQPVNDIPKITDINRTNIFNLTLLIFLLICLTNLSVS